jgi:phosphatidylglycerol---prolipoprotein diacylglyceryl transferase
MNKSDLLLNPQIYTKQHNHNTMLAFIDWNANPEIINLFGFSIRWYGLCFAMAFLAGYQVLSYVFKKEGRPQEQATVIGARMGHYFFYEYPLLLQDPGKFFWEMIKPPYAGLASHGTAVGMFTGLYIYARKYKQPYLYVTDRVVLTVALGGAFIRFGNLMNSEILGKPTDVAWAFRFMKDPEYLMGRYELLPRHPAQLYESLSCIVLFFVMMYIWNIRKENTRHGLLTGIFMIILFTLRFFYEFLKENQVNFESGMQLNMGQWLSIPSVLFGVIVLVYALKKKETNEISQKEPV